MSFAVRSRYLRLILPAVLLLLCLAGLFWLLGGSGALYRFRTPQTADSLELRDLQGAYFTVPADLLAEQTYAFMGYTDEAENTVIEERFCYLVVEGKYLSIRVTKADVAELAKYEEREELVASGAIGSMLELQFAELRGTVVPGEDRETRPMLEQWISGQNIRTDRDGSVSDTATGADLSSYAETGDYSPYFREVILPYHATIGSWGSRSEAGATTLAVLALVFLLLAVALLITIPLGLWERPYREALRKWGKPALRKDFAQGRRFGRRNNLVLGDTYVWWLRSFSSRVMPVEDILWVYPRSRRLEGGRKDWSLGLRSEQEQWSVRLGELSTVHLAMEAIRDKGHPVAMGFDKEKQKLFEKDLPQFRAKTRNGSI